MLCILRCVSAQHGCKACAFESLYGRLPVSSGFGFVLFGFLHPRDCCVWNSDSVWNTRALRVHGKCENDKAAKWSRLRSAEKIYESKSWPDVVFPNRRELSRGPFLYERRRRRSSYTRDRVSDGRVTPDTSYFAERFVDAGGFRRPGGSSSVFVLKGF